MNENLINKLAEIEIFVTQVRIEAMNLKGVNQSGHTFLLSRSCQNDAILHNRYETTVYFNDEKYFTIDIVVDGHRFSASVMRDSNGNYNPNFSISEIKTFIQYEDDIRDAWTKSKEINALSIIEKRITGKQNQLELKLRECDKLRTEIKELQAINKNN